MKQVFVDTLGRKYVSETGALSESDSLLPFALVPVTEEEVASESEESEEIATESQASESGNLPTPETVSHGETLSGGETIDTVIPLGGSVS